jgi:SAM-dependent MidA family methyltransferase
MQPEHSTGFALPEPDAESTAHSRRVAEYIRERITEGSGSISFAEFMQHALYAPGLGYYVSGTRKFGEGGDFVTAPEISPLFGKILAIQTAAVLQQLEARQIFELGAGSGALAATMLGKLAQIDALPDRYYILEVSADLRQRQQERLEQEIPGHATRVEWLSELPQDFSGVIVANEVADAIPVERFARSGGVLKQYRVSDERGKFCWHQADAPEQLLHAIQSVEEELGWQFPDDYRSEICLALTAWIRDLVGCLHEGHIFLFDYGVSRREYYAPDRNDGWLRCYFRHHAHNDPLILPGIQDLTASVDFSALASAAVEAGATITGFVTQAHFLLNGGLQDELADFVSLPIEEQVELSRQAKLLTLPAEMGENVKCIGMSRGNITPPPAFHEFDRAHTL